MKKLRWRFAALLLLMVATRVVSGQALSPAVTSSTSLSSKSAGTHSIAPVFSANGRFLAFCSQANNLVSNDNTLGFSDVFVRDLVTGTTTLVSVSTNGVGGGNGNSYEPSLSADGQFIVFQSTASNLVLGDNNGVLDVFIRDLANGTTKLVSSDPGGNLAANSRSMNAHLTPDHHWVVFESQSSNVVGGDVNGIQDVFIRDLQSVKTYLVSVGAQGAGHKSGSPSVSDDGQRVAFESDAQFFGSNLTYSLGEVYVRDRFTNTTIWASSNLYLTHAAARTSYRALAPALSANGRFLAFKTTPSLSPTATDAALYFLDLQTMQLTQVSTNTSDGILPEVTSDGHWVAYQDGANVYLWDSTTGTNLLISCNLAGTGPANGTSTRPLLSGDAGKVLFLSDASDLTTNSVNGKPQLYLRDLVSNATRLISSSPDGTARGDLGGIRADLSLDGSNVAFESDDETLVSEDYNQSTDVFLRRVGSGSTELISNRDPNLPNRTSPGWVSLGPQSLSADGRYAVFSSLDGTLTENDRNGEQDAFLRDLATGTNQPLAAFGGGGLQTNVATLCPVISSDGAYAAYFVRAWPDTHPVDQLYLCDLARQTNNLISRNWTNDTPANGSSRRAQFSRDATKLVFESEASDLVPGDDNGVADVFLRDSNYRSNALISVNHAGTSSGNAFSGNPSISPDGRWVVFESQATDLLSNTLAATGISYLYARDLGSNVTSLISVAPGGNWVPGSNALFSADSRSVVFSAANNVYSYDLYTGSNQAVCLGCRNPSVSGDGRWVAYETAPALGLRDVLVKDLQTGTFYLVSTNRNDAGGNGGDASSFSPQISYDGRFVAFLSRAANLVDLATNHQTQVLVWDRLLNQTLLATINRNGTGAGNGLSFNLRLASDGHTILFQSFSSDLVDGDFDNRQNIFTLSLDTTDQDADGLPDDWEWAWFGTLARDGAGDFDRDGVSDWQEFLAGTNPTDPGSALRILTLDSFSGGRMVLWFSVPGQIYQVQYKDDLSASSWTNLGPPVTAIGSTASVADPEGVSVTRRFYRVTLTRVQ